MHKKNLLIAILIPLLYLSSYWIIKSTKPEFLNTNDGPTHAYQSLYYPLRLLDSERPNYCKSLFKPSIIGANVTSVNRETDVLFFIYEGEEFRVGAKYIPDSIEAGDTVILTIEFELETWDDYQNHLIPTITSIGKLTLNFLE